MLMDRKHKSAGPNSGESGVRNLEAESIRSGAESPRRCVKLKTVTEIRRSSARDTFIAESVYLVLDSLLDCFICVCGWMSGEEAGAGERGTEC